MEDIKSTELEKKTTTKEETPAPTKRNVRSEFQIKMEKMKERDYKLVRGVFKRFKNPEVPLKFYFKKYKGPIMEFTLKDGYVYEIPYMVAEHLHKNCYIPEHKNITDEEGKNIHVVGRKIKCYDFISPDIIVDAEPEKEIITIQRGF